MAKILICEPNQALRSSLVSALTQKGHDVAATRDLETILAYKAFPCKWDLVLIAALTLYPLESRYLDPYLLGLKFIERGDRVVFLADEQPGIEVKPEDWIKRNSGLDKVIQAVYEALEPKAPVSNGKRILYMNHTFEMRETMKMVLTLAGYTVETVGTPEEFKRAFETTPYSWDLVMTNQVYESSQWPYHYGRALLDKGQKVLFVSMQRCEPTDNWIDANSSNEQLLQKIAKMLAQ